MKICQINLKTIEMVHDILLNKDNETQILLCEGKKQAKQSMWL